jgi:antitoxin component YwqK of YwqJK toxin-antitoxin module
MDGHWEFYYDNGQLGKRENYKDGLLDGLWEYFDKDGRLKEQRNY